MGHCSHCSRQAAFLCGRCRVAQYCSAECQALDWEAGHGSPLQCVAAAAAALPLEAAASVSQKNLALQRPPTDGQLEISVDGDSRRLNTLAPMRYTIGRGRTGYLYELYGDDQLLFPRTVNLQTVRVSVDLFGALRSEYTRKSDVDALRAGGLSKIAEDKRKMEAEKKRLVTQPCTYGVAHSRIDELERNIRSGEYVRRGYQSLFIDEASREIELEKVPSDGTTRVFETDQDKYGVFAQFTLGRTRANVLRVERVRLFLPDKVVGI